MTSEVGPLTYVYDPEPVVTARWANLEGMPVYNRDGDVVAHVGRIIPRDNQDDLLEFTVRFGDVAPVVA